MLQRLAPDKQWAEGVVNDLPPRWRQRFMRSWRNTRGGDESDNAPAERRSEANTKLVEAIERMEAVRLPLDANDGDVCERAAWMANACEQATWAIRDVEAQRKTLAEMCEAAGVEPPGKKCEDAPAVARTA